MASDKHFHAGWDHFTPDPGTVDSMKCKVCNAEMDVKREREGPTSSIMAMGGFKRKYDAFSCPNVGEKWHNQLISLKEFKRKLPSKILADIVEQEIQQILDTKKETKEVSRFGTI